MKLLQNNSKKNMLILALVALFALVGTACGGEKEDNSQKTEDIDYSEFKPFDEQNMTNQLARLESHTDIVTLRKEATLENAADIFGQIEDAYQAYDLNQKVAGRQDDHIEVEGWGFSDIGGFLDQHITYAIDLGKSGEDESEIAWAGQVVDKGLQVFFYYSVYHELYLKKRKNFDEAFGYYGLGFDGQPREHAPLANNAVAREQEYSLTINAPIFKAFIDARHALAEGTSSNDEQLGDNEVYDSAWMTIDRKMLDILGHYALHEIDVMTADNADIKIIEARVIWEALAMYAEEVDADAAATVMEGLYPGGTLERSDDNYFYTGLEDIRDGVVEIDTQALRNAMLAILETLEN